MEARKALPQVTLRSFGGVFFGLLYKCMIYKYDQDLISPQCFKPKSNMQVMRVHRLITKEKFS